MAVQVLIGTTNPSKVRRFEELLKGYNLNFLTLRDLHIEDEPKETGNTPEENAVLKARFYGTYFDRVICNDSGLYLDGLALDDERQPGLNIRSPRGKRLDDEEMIEYYASLAHSLGGKVPACYLDGIAVYNQGVVMSFMEDRDNVEDNAFYLVDQVSEKRHPGWPLDSISLDRSTGISFVDEDDGQNESEEDHIMVGEYAKKLTAFLAKALGLEG
ncbi:MAG: non-canonical purine NTP pyrophosphatase [Lachnospiraceae bacterium]|nr:non-canonical purine NTP pyrophosphatase [Lachnospiraceae bacterium]